VHEGTLAEDAVRKADQRSLALAAASHTVVDVDSVTSLGCRLLRVHSLRAADALQLGAALFFGPVGVREDAPAHKRKACARRPPRGVRTALIGPIVAGAHVHASRAL
jgi:hypothetical protein